MKRLSVCFCLFFFVCICGRGQSSETAAMGDVRLNVSLDGAGTPVYTVSYKGRPVILSSRLGFVLNEDSTFYKGFVWKGVSRRSVDTVWKPVWGEVASIRDHHEELTVHLMKPAGVGASGPGRWLEFVV